MKQVAIEQLSDQLSELVSEIQAGEDVLFTRGNIPVARLISISPEKKPATRNPGSAKDLPHFMADDFDAIPEGFEEYMAPRSTDSSSLSV